MGISTKQVAEQLASEQLVAGLSALYSLMRNGSVPTPRRLHGSAVMVWTPADIEAVREALAARASCRRKGARPATA